MNEKFIMALIDRFENSKIDEFDLHDGNVRLVLKKGVPAGTGLPCSETAGQSVHLGISAETEIQGNIEKITSPIVATFFAAPSPDSPTFVKPGLKVKAGQTLCILEAMKMMNRLETEFDCEIIETHAANGDFVEYGQVLFTVKRF